MIETNVSSWLFVVIVAVAGFTIGLSKSGLGSGLGAMVTPLMSLALPNVAVTLAVVLPMLMVGDAFAVYAYWGQWDGALVRRLLPGAFVGIAVGLLALVSLPERSMRLALGLFSLGLIVYKIAGDSIRRWRYQPRPWHASAIGLLSGTASTLFNAGGPPLSAYLLLNGVAPRVFIATGAIFFAIVNLSKVPGFVAARILSLPILASVWWGFLFVPLGAWAGQGLLARIDPRAFDWLVTGLLLVASGLLIWQSL